MEQLQRMLKPTVSDFEVVVDTIVMVLYLERLELERNLWLQR